MDVSLRSARADCLRRAGATVGQFDFSTDFIEPGAWGASPLFISNKPVVTALETDNQLKVEEAKQWNFLNPTWNDSSALSIPARKFVFLRGVDEWDNQLYINFGGTPVTDVQLSLMMNAATRGDKQRTVPVFTPEPPCQKDYFNTLLGAVRDMLLQDIFLYSGDLADELVRTLAQTYWEIQNGKSFQKYEPEITIEILNEVFSCAATLLHNNVGRDYIPGALLDVCPAFRKLAKEVYWRRMTQFKAAAIEEEILEIKRYQAPTGESYYCVEGPIDYTLNGVDVIDCAECTKWERSKKMPNKVEYCPDGTIRQGGGGIRLRSSGNYRGYSVFGESATPVAKQQTSLAIYGSAGPYSGWNTAGLPGESVAQLNPSVKRELDEHEMAEKNGYTPASREYKVIYLLR